MIELFDTLDIIEAVLAKADNHQEMIDLLYQERARVLNNIQDIEMEMYAEYEKDQQ